MFGMVDQKQVGIAKEPPETRKPGVIISQIFYGPLIFPTLLLTLFAVGKRVDGLFLCWDLHIFV
jgi:hypothetical protein